MKDLSMKFGACEICGSTNWSEIYNGPIRYGKHGETKEGSVAECDLCTVRRLNENLCLSSIDYESAGYRNMLDESHDERQFADLHHRFHSFSLRVLDKFNIRGKVVADVGAGGATLLDNFAGIAKRIIAIEPNEFFASQIIDRGYDYFSYASEARRDFEGEVDLVNCSQVIEHVENPKEFVREIYSLVKPGGHLIVSTPNRNDILTNICASQFLPFFYRCQHRWYFDQGSLEKCFELSGIQNVEFEYVHRYGLSNALHWLSEQEPRGWEDYPGVPIEFEKMWKLMCEQQKAADQIYVIAQKNAKEK